MELNVLRDKIDSIDEAMLKLFLERMEVSEQVIDYKNTHNLAIENRSREREILAKVENLAADKGEYAYHLFSRIIQLSKVRQNELMTGESRVRAMIEKAKREVGDTFPKAGMVACQGVEGSNAQIACDKMLSRGTIMYVRSFKAVFDAVESGLCKYGVVPIENSANGSVRAVYELLAEKKFSIIRTTNLCIRHNLMAKKGVKLEDITEIYSHEQAIGQCSKFLAQFPKAKIIPCENTAVAAKMVSESGSPTAASISAPECASLYGLSELACDIQDSQNNYTRFICITKEPTIYAGANKISLIFTCGNRSGDLHSVLSKFAARGINMNKLESCPISGRDFEFMFFVELDASIYEPAVVSMLEDMERVCPSFEFLGNYSIA